MDTVLERADVAEQLGAAAAVGMVASVWASVQPDKVAVYDPDGSAHSFEKINANANRLARLFRSHGVKPGDALALVCSNRHEFVEALAASLRTGVRLTPVNWHLTADEIGYIIRDCEAKVLVGDIRVGALEEAARDCPNLVLRLAVGGAIAGFEGYEEAIASIDGTDIADPVLGTQMMYTSGTTGRPKGVFRPGPRPRRLSRSAGITTIAPTSSSAQGQPTMPLR